MKPEEIIAKLDLQLAHEVERRIKAETREDKLRKNKPLLAPTEPQCPYAIPDGPLGGWCCQRREDHGGEHYIGVDEGALTKALEAARG